MNIIDALRTGLPLRRPIAKHTGSGKTGWLGNEYVKMLLTSDRHPDLYSYTQIPLINELDLMANDWETKND